MTPVLDKHIILDDNGVAKVAGTGYKVRLLAGEYRRGDSPERIQSNHPDLTLGQVYAVLAYYHDRKTEMDADMDRRTAEVERMREEAGEPPFVARMKAAGLLPHKRIPSDEDIYAEIEASRQT